MKEYNFETCEVGKERLKTGLLSTSDYSSAHSGLVIVTHDVFLKYKNGILLARRHDNPCRDQLFSIGGRIKRGMSIEDSLKEKVKDEVGLNLSDLSELGTVRFFFETSPCIHNKGTDQICFVYFGRGEGELKLDNSLFDPIIVTLSIYNNLKGGLHPYVRDYMEKVLPLLNNRNLL